MVISSEGPSKTGPVPYAGEPPVQCPDPMAGPAGHARAQVGNRTALRLAGVESSQRHLPRLGGNRGSVGLHTRAASADPDLLAGAVWILDFPVRPIMRTDPARHLAPQTLAPRHGHVSVGRGKLAI
jgi:hypothetical protein